jgi:hypothetical protein
MSTETNDTAERLQFRERYRTMTDDDLARLALYEDLMPAAREAITEELEARGLRDLSSFQKQFEDDAILAKAEGLSAFTPVKARPPVQKDLARNQRLLGLTGLLMFGLVGVHKWLLGDATTWRKEESLAVWLFLGLMLTWDPMVRVVRGQASRKLAVWLVLALLQIAMPAAVLAVPGLGRRVSGYSSPLVLAILFSPAIAFAVHRGVKRIARRSQ